MNRINLVFSMIFAALCLSACAAKQPELKSPCVGVAGSPCTQQPINTPVRQS